MIGSVHGSLIGRLAAVWGRRNRLVAGLLFFLLVVGIYYVGVKGSSRSAFNRWKPQVVEFWQGEDIYLRYGFPTPPVMVMILTPFSLMPGSLGMTAWFVFKSLLVVLVVGTILRHVDRWDRPLPEWVVGLGLLLAARPVMGICCTETSISGFWEWWSAGSCCFSTGGTRARECFSPWGWRAS